MKQYVVLDTNVLVKFVTQGQSGFEQEHFDSLRHLVQSGEVTLFSPEIVELEFQSLIEPTTRKYAQHFEVVQQRAIKALETANGYFDTPDNKSDKPQEQNDKSKAKQPEKEKIETWNEMGKLHAYLKEEAATFSTKLTAWHDNIKGEMKSRIDQLNSMLSLPSVVKLTVDENIMLRTRKRFILKKFPKDERSDQDAMILDSVIRYFESNEKARVLLCSDNHTDFGSPLKEGGFTLNTLFKDELPNGSGLFLTLKDLVATIQSGKQIPQPKPEDIKEPDIIDTLQEPEDTGLVLSDDDIEMIRHQLRNSLTELSNAITYLVDYRARNTVREIIAHCSDLFHCIDNRVFSLNEADRLMRFIIFLVDNALSDHELFPKDKRPTKLAADISRLRNSVRVLSKLVHSDERKLVEHHVPWNLMNRKSSDWHD